MDKRKELIVGVILAIGFILTVYILFRRQATSSTVNKPVQVSPTKTTNKTPYPLVEVEKHSSIDNCWFVIDGLVYDVTAYANEHPGGVSTIAEYCGQDATKAYNAERKHGARAKVDLSGLEIGVLK